MRRLVIVLAVLAVVLAILLGVRVRRQAAADRAPAGGSGEIEAVEVDLAARISARVLEWHVREGDAVKKGAPILTLDCADAEAQRADAEARLAAARAQEEAAGASLASARRSREAATAQGAAARAQAEALAVQRDLAERTAGRVERLADAAAESSRDESRAQAVALSAQAKAAQAQASASGQQARAAEASIRTAEAQAQAAEAQRRASEAALARARLLTDECRVVAPRDAIVEELPHEPGELAAVGAVLARLVDLSEVRAVFYLPNAEVGAARPGADAEVVADAWPGETFRGRILTVSAEAEFTPRNIQTRTDRDRLVYPIEVAVPNPEAKLRPGMPVQVSLPGTGR